MTLLPNPSGSSRGRLALRSLALLIGVALLAGCAQTGQMVYMPRYDVYEPGEFFADGQSARQFPEGAVPYTGEVSPNDPSLTGLGEDGEPVSANPVEITAAVVERGQERFEIFCTPCHGPTGDGNGPAVTIGRFPAPPNLRSSNLSDGEMFDVITNGQGNMFPYGYRVKPADRWAVIAYVRGLQLREGAFDPDELTAEELNQLGGQP